MKGKGLSLEMMSTTIANILNFTRSDMLVVLSRN
jgi:hypothetical protein